MDNMKSSVFLLHRHAGLLFAVLYAFAGLTAMAQPAAQMPPIYVQEDVLPFRQYDRIEITGSSIVRKVQTQALPVQVISREDIRRSGALNLAQLLHALPSMHNITEPGQMGMSGGGYAGASLHGLPNGTLVLVNGLRMAPFGRPGMVGPERTGVDLVTLPLQDVERIEVLSDGASSLYGTDAIAGVINIILRSERRGLELQAQRRDATGLGTPSQRVGLSWGQGRLARDGYSLMLSVDVDQQPALKGRHRRDVSRARHVFALDGHDYEVFGTYYTIWRSPATLRSQDTPEAPRRFVNDYYRDGRCVGESLTFEGQAACYRDAYAGLDIYPEQKQARLHLRGEWMPAAGHTAWLELLAGHSRWVQANNWWPAATSAFGLPQGSLAAQKAMEAGLDPARTRLMWMPELPALRSASEQLNARVALGQRGQWHDWDYQLSAALAHSGARSMADSLGVIRYDSLGLVNGAVWDNPDVLRPLDDSNPLTAALEALRGDLKTDSQGHQRLAGLQWRASRPIAERLGQDVLLGIGADWRQEQVDYRNALTSQPPFGQTSLRTHRQVTAAFAELQLPMAQDWELNLGWRSDHYSDVGATHNAKLHTRWVLDPRWSMRGSVGTGFRAPSAAQTHAVPEAFVWGQTTQPLTCSPAQQAIAAQLRTAAGEAGFCNPSIYPLVMGNGNPQLRPEQSTQLTWGMAFVPHRNLRLAADVWAVKVRDTLQLLSDTLVLNDPVRYAAYYRLMPKSYARLGFPANALALELPMLNLGWSERAGVDLEIQWRHPGAWGRWSLQAQATYMLRSRTRLNDSEPATSDLGRFATETGTVTPRWRLRAEMGLTRQDHTLALTLRHTGGYADAPVLATRLATGQQETVVRQVASMTTFDVRWQYAWRRDVDLQIGLRNVLNRQAPLSLVPNSIQVFGASTAHSDLWGRVVEIGFNARF